MMRTFNKLMAPWTRRLRLLVTRGVVKRVDDTKGIQELQISALDGELLDAIERLQQYGITSHPLEGADTINLNVGASRSHTIVIAVDDRRYRLKLKPGEVALHDDQGQAVTLLRDGMVIEAPKGTTHKGDMAINGDVDINGILTLNGVVVNDHGHPITSGSSAGITGAMQ